MRLTMLLTFIVVIGHTLPTVALPSCNNIYSRSVVQGLSLQPSFREVLQLILESVPTSNLSSELVSSAIFLLRSEKFVSRPTKFSWSQPQLAKKRNGNIEIHWPRRKIITEKDAELLVLQTLDLVFSYAQVKTIKELHFTARWLSVFPIKMNLIADNILLQSVLYSQKQMHKHWKMRKYFPWNWLKTSSEYLDSSLAIILETEGIDAFRSAVIKRYGLKTGINVILKFSQYLITSITVTTTAVSLYMIYQANLYFERTLVLDTGITNEQQLEAYNQILHKSGYPSEQQILQFFKDKSSTNSDLRDFVSSLEAELNDNK